MPPHVLIATECRTLGYPVLAMLSEACQHEDEALVAAMRAVLDAPGRAGRTEAIRAFLDARHPDLARDEQIKAQARQEAARRMQQKALKAKPEKLEPAKPEPAKPEKLEPAKPEPAKPEKLEPAKPAPPKARKAPVQHRARKPQEEPKACKEEPKVPDAETMQLFAAFLASQQMKRSAPEDGGQPAPKKQALLSPEKLSLALRCDTMPFH